MEVIAKAKGKAYRTTEEYFTTKVAGKPVTIKPFTPPRFEVDDPAALEYLEENGYVVFKNIATDAETQTGIEIFWNHLEKESEGAISRYDPVSWKFWPGRHINSGVVTDMGIGQSAFLWHARGIPKVAEIFARIWHTDELLTSFDGCGTLRPPELHKKYITRAGWYHIDQNGYNKKGRICVQGLLNFFPSGDLDGGLVVVPGSHKIFEKLFKKYDNMGNSDYVKMDRDIPELWREYHPIKVNLSPGDFACWDSRTVHCNHPAYSQPEIYKPEAGKLRRLVAYVCMTPTKFATQLDELKAKRLEAVSQGITSTHWPHEFYASAAPYESKTFKTSDLPLSDAQVSLIVGKKLNLAFLTV